MAFIESRLLDKIALGFSGGPEFRTRVVQLANGREKRNIDWSQPRRRYVAPYGNIDPTKYAQLLSAFTACRGQAHGFRFKDWLDYTATDEPLGNAPSGTTAVQLVKAYTFGTETISRTIAKPVTVTVKQNGVTKAGAVDTATGLFTPTTAWTAGQPLTWSGEFDVPVRFGNDYLPASWDNQQAINADVELLELFL